MYALLLMLCAGAVAGGGDDRVKELRKARLTIARQGLETLEKKLVAGAVNYPRVWLWSLRVLKSELAVSTTRAERIAALEAHLDRARRLERIARTAYERGAFSLADRLEAEYRRADAEVLLARAKAGKAPRGK